MMKKVLGFYRTKDPLGCLSNWAISPFTLNGVSYVSSEQYMMHQKALVFGDRKTAAKILRTDSQAEIKELGKQVCPYDDVVWSGLRQVIVYEGLLAKFRQNPEMLEELLGTGDAILAECSPTDRIWGIGIPRDGEYQNTAKWRGTNLLGFALMQVREKLKLEKEEETAK